MDFEYSVNNLPPSLNGTFWIMFALSASCVFSVAVVYLISRIMKCCYSSRYQEDVINTEESTKRVTFIAAATDKNDHQR